jgi:hypothetical protein
MTVYRDWYERKAEKLLEFPCVVFDASIAVRFIENFLHYFSPISNMKQRSYSECLRGLLLVRYLGSRISPVK